jgi:hypothetical protein
MNEQFSDEYQKAIDNLIDTIEEMKLSGDYDIDTLETIIWRMS